MRILIYALALFATSSCTLGCTWPQQAPVDPNQATIKLMQQRTFDRALNILEKVKVKDDPQNTELVPLPVNQTCPVEKKKSCTELLDEYNDRCLNQTASYDVG